MARELGLGMAGVQWVLNGYFLSLGALMLMGGSLGDRHGHRRIFLVGIVLFAIFSLLCALAPGLLALVLFRLGQGVAGALLVPNSLAILSETFAHEERGAAIGAWSGWSAVSTALGPVLGGWLVDVGSWRWVFGLMVPLSLLAALIGAVRLSRTAPDARSRDHNLDWRGTALVTTGLAATFGALISGQERGFADPWIVAGLAGGAVVLLAFPFVEARARNPLVPPELFRNPQFAGGNVVTLLIYTALSALLFLLVVHLQATLGYSALAAGAALLPVNGLMLLLSSPAGRLGTRVGPGWPVAGGAVLAGAGMLLLSHVGAGSEYVEGVLPGLSLFGLGLAALVAPLTDAVLSAADEDRSGVASGVNNAIARLAGLIGTAAVPLAVGLGGLEDLGGTAFASGYRRALLVSAALCAIAAFIAPLALRTSMPGRPIAHPSPTHGCVERPRSSRAR
jgi:EmrB/QacA subfamily drug resistance transporter